MNLVKQLCDKVIQSYVESNDINIHITDQNAQIISSTDAAQINNLNKTALYGLTSKKSFLIRNEPSDGSNNDLSMHKLIYCIPLIHKDTIEGSIVIEGNDEDIKILGNSMKITMSIILDHQLMINEPSKDFETQLINALIHNPDNQMLIDSLLQSLHINPESAVTVICIKLSSKENKYFDNSLDLGYQESISQTQKNLRKITKANQFLTTNDIVAYNGLDELIIIKTSTLSDNHTEMYQALDGICKSLLEDLSHINIFSFNIAYGNICKTIHTAKNSYDEAKEIMFLGLMSKSSTQFFKLEDFLYENICNYLHPQIVNKLILPFINNLTKKDGSLNESLIKIGESFVDHCMSYTKTAEALFMHRNTIDKNLEKYKQLTGLSPSDSFHDAFLIKMIAIYTKYYYSGTITHTD